MQRCKRFNDTAGCSQSSRWLKWCRDGIPSVGYHHGYISQLLIEMEALIF